MDSAAPSVDIKVKCNCGQAHRPAHPSEPRTCRKCGGQIATSFRPAPVIVEPVVETLVDPLDDEGVYLFI